MGGPLTREGGGDQPVISRIPLTGHKKPCLTSLKLSKGKDRQVGWVKETDKITFANFIHNFDFKYLGVKSNYVKTRKEHNFEICIARDDDKMY